MVLWYIALALVVTAGIVGVLLARKNSELDENSATRIASEIEIIE